MARAYRDRSSYKPSEVVGLFLLSMMSTMFVCLLLASLEDVLNSVFG